MRASSRANRTWQRWSGYLFVLPYLVLFTGFLVLPMAYGLVLSFFRWEMLFPAPPQFLGLAVLGFVVFTLAVTRFKKRLD